MVKKQRGFKATILPRTLSASFAGIRAGSALAADSVVQRVLGRGPDAVSYTHLTLPTSDLV